MPFLKNGHRKSLTQISSLPALQKKNTLPYEGGGSFLIFKCHLKIFLTHFSYLFSCKSISAA